MKLASWIMIVALGLSGCAAKSPHDEAAAIRAVLADQQAAWNACDIARFMDGYWHDPNLRFASGGKITHGWQATLTGYKQRYQDCAKMGKLGFSGLEVQVFSRHAAQVFGHWALTRAGDHPHGLFTLTFAKKRGHWRIVADHTSVATDG